MASGIYRIDMGEGNFYIGSAVNLHTRKNSHISGLKRDKHGNPRMQFCWNKYGVFEFVVLEECEAECLLSREQYWLDKHFTDTKNLNILPTAGSSYGRVASAETRAKISAANIGRKATDETRAKLRASWKLRPPVSAEVRAKMSASMTGSTIANGRRRPHTAETRAKYSAAQKGKVVSKETKAKLSAVHKGKILSGETKAKISASLKGRVHSEETKAKISAARRGKVVSEETKAKLSAARRKRVIKEETKIKTSESLKRYHKNRKEEFLLGRHPTENN